MGFPPLRSKRSVYTIPPDRHYVWRRGRGSNSPKTDRQSAVLPEYYHGNVWSPLTSVLLTSDEGGLTPDAFVGR